MARSHRERIEASRRYAMETNYAEHLEYSSLDENKAELNFSLRTYGENKVNFHKRYWDNIKRAADPVEDFLRWSDNKNDIADQFRSFYRVKNKLGYSEARKGELEYLKKLGFVESKTSSDYNKKFTHKLKVQDLKDLFRQKAEAHFKDETKAHTEYMKLLNQPSDDIKNREVFVNRVKFFHDFVSEFEKRERNYRVDIERIQLRIGKGNYESLAGPRDSYRFALYPKHARTSAFRALNYAKEWLLVYEPIINEIERLKTALNAPEQLKNMGYDREVFTKWEHVDIVKLANFDYQAFLTFLLDFRQRFGKKSRGEKRALLGGCSIFEHNHKGEYENRHYRADEWNVFNCVSDSQQYRHESDQKTYNELLNDMLENGEIYTISSAGRMAEIVKHTNRQYHTENKGLDRYKRTPLIRVKVSDEQDAEAGRWKL